MLSKSSVPGMPGWPRGRLLWSRLTMVATSVIASEPVRLECEPEMSDSTARFVQIIKTFELIYLFYKNISSVFNRF